MQRLRIQYSGPGSILPSLHLPCSGTDCEFQSAKALASKGLSHVIPTGLQSYLALQIAEPLSAQCVQRPSWLWRPMPPKKSQVSINQAEVHECGRDPSKASHVDSSFDTPLATRMEQRAAFVLFGSCCGAARTGLKLHSGRGPSEN